MPSKQSHLDDPSGCDLTTSHIVVLGRFRIGKPSMAKSATVDCNRGSTPEVLLFFLRYYLSPFACGRLEERRGYGQKVKSLRKMVLPQRTTLRGLPQGIPPEVVQQVVFFIQR